MRRITPAKQFCRENKGFSYNHLRALDREGLVQGICHLGRRLYVDEELFGEFLRNGGARLRGGWKRKPQPDGELDTETSAVGDGSGAAER